MHQIFDNTRKPMSERNLSPFNGPQQTTTTTTTTAPSYPLRNHEVNVSRGIFSNKKENVRSDNTPRTKYTNSTDQGKAIPSTYAQVLKEFLDNDLQAQITQFRNEMVKVMNESLRDFNEKSNRNHETITVIKESIKNHGNNIDILDQKIEEYHSSLNTISELFQSEIEKIRQNVPYGRVNQVDGKRKGDVYQDQRLRTLESQQQDLLLSFERLKDEVTQSIQLALQDYGHISERETNNRISQISSEITQNMEQKIERVLSHLDGKVQVLEKQIQNYGKPDDAIVDNLRFQMEDKVSEQTLSIRQQIQDLYQMIEAKPVEEAQLGRESTVGVELDQRIDETRQELDKVRSELASVIEEVRMNSRSVNTKLEDYERKFNEECNQLKKYRAETGSKQGQEELERKVSNIERRFEEIHQEQITLNSDINIQKAQLDSFKTTSAINFSDIKNNQTELGDVRLKKLEQLVDQLTKTVQTYKPSSALSETTSSDTGPVNERGPASTIKHENFTSFGFPAGIKQQQQQQQAYGNNTAFSSGYTADTGYPKTSENLYQKDYLGYSNTVGTGTGELGGRRMAPEKGYSATTNYGGVGSNLDKEVGQYKDAYNPEAKTWEKYSGGYTGVEQKKEEDKNSKSLKERRPTGDGNEDDEVEVVYQINENGYLMDEDGNFIYDDQGEMIKLNEKQIQQLRENNLLEEENPLSH